MLYQDLEMIVNGNVELEDLKIPGVKITYVGPENYTIKTALNCSAYLDYMDVINWLKDYA